MTKVAVEIDKEIWDAFVKSVAEARSDLRENVSQREPDETDMGILQSLMQDENAIFNCFNF
jgi:hypothetical protein|tara:strand:+ start:2325 stop:2507 length:183 start_codon:yes stop_codon:yes gene_type:complete